MSRLTDYLDAVFDDPITDAIKRANERLEGGGTATATPAGAGAGVRNIGGKWYVVDVNGKAVSRAYDSQAEAQGALDYNDYTTAGGSGTITPPSLEGGAGLAERYVAGDTGNWRVLNRAGETLAGPFRTQAIAENELENIELGITRPATAGASGGAGGAGGSGTDAEAPPQLTASQIQELVSVGRMTVDDALRYYDMLPADDYAPEYAALLRDRFYASLQPQAFPSRLDPFGTSTGRSSAGETCAAAVARALWTAA